MTRQRRSDMKPGTIFVAAHHYRGSTKQVCVVVDDRSEVDFWYGHKVVWGDVAPSWMFEVIGVPK